ncbi:MAG: sigma-70 family RNA polymerase sigma factor [Planctomycetes bacterium]|nr:sigma-70 family RNA polymerase sigma factor [Planctomycetota bacterium]MBI3847216.1 sigma-70 family RNA polymerase sigma factor [Planctomycetota bacterium]
MTEASQDVTRLLGEVNAGEVGAWERLLHRVYGELKLVARGQMAHERDDHVLQTTALVNEAYIRLVQNRDERWESRAHFFSAAATAMRRILVDEARARKADKRGGGVSPTRIRTASAFHPSAPIDDEMLEDIEAVHLALEKLEVDGRQREKCKVVELRFFVGLSIEETANVLGISIATVKRHWDFARAWLRREIKKGSNDGR